MSELAATTTDANTRIWRAVAIAGAAASLLVAIGQSYPFEGRQLASVFVAIPVLIAAAVVLVACFGEARETLLKKPDLLVPAGVVMLATTAIGSLAGVPALTPLLMASWNPKLPFPVFFRLSLAELLNITVWTAYAAWQTDLLWRYVRDGRLDSIDPTVPIRDGFWRALAALGVGIGVLLATTGPIIGSMMLGNFVVALLALGVVGVVWNLWTAAILPVTLETPGSVFGALGLGLRRSWDLKQCWWKQLAALLLVMGLVVIPNPGSFNVNAFWLGGYEHECRWLAKWVDVLGLKPLPILVVLVDLCFLVLAVSMKLCVVRVLVAHTPPSEATSDFVEANPWGRPTA